MTEKAKATENAKAKDAPALEGEIDGVQTPNPISDPSQMESAPKED